ncbi:toxin Tbo-IT2-like isoform X1 [Microplitis mediator]|uniref:toxin Tbo-IT2-like isoform X1 n=1 Tax=Microplitis mediator TaxID=375433 RepID=UPI002555E609|nr:toxin Tbo-IT2-like isoform X1 [Microplitis mediator]
MALKISVFSLFFILCVLAVTINAGPYFEEEMDGMPVDSSDYSDNTLEDIMRVAQQKRSPYMYVFRRGCIRRDGNCDHRPNDCCYSSSCRCNLWGSNCRCQRVGLFQKWG